MKKTLYIFLLVFVVAIPSVSFAKTDVQISAYDKKIEVLVKKMDVLQKQLDKLLAQRQKRADVLVAKGMEVAPPVTEVVKVVSVRKVGRGDHIRGNPDAPIMLVEYSDFECPYCKMFHETLTKIYSEYGASGKVAWVYRHFPIEQLHPNAEKIAEASECVSANGGDFWKFADTIFGSREIRAFTDMAKLEDYAVSAGAERAAFKKCLAHGLPKKKVADSVNEFMKLTDGRAGTPETFIVIGGQSYPIEGAQPYDVVKNILDNLITQMKNPTPSK